MIITATDAILAIRHVVQDHGDEHTVIRRGAHMPGILWFGQLLGWRWPPSYLQVLEKHDGVMVRHAILSSVRESIETMLVYHSRWHRPDGFWPVGHDECGDYYALDFSRQAPDGECPVVFIETMLSATEPQSTCGSTYAEFVVRHMAEECEDVECSWRAEEMR